MQYCYGPTHNSKNDFDINENRKSSFSHIANTSSLPLQSSGKIYFPNTKLKKNFITGTPSTSSPHSSPQQMPRQHPSQSSQQHKSPWSSPKLMLKTNNSTQRASSAGQRREKMQRGYSQDVDSAHETLRRRTALLRMQDCSLSYDLDNENEPLFTQLSTKANTSTGSVVVAVTPPRIPTPTTLPLPTFAHHQNQHQTRTSYNP